jgi:hypothetical protein
MRNGNKSHPDPITNQSGNRGGCEHSYFAAKQIKNAYRLIANRDSLQHSVDAQRSQRKEWEPVDNDSEKEKDDRACEDVAQEGAARLVPREARFDGKNDRNADKKQERGKD